MKFIYLFIITFAFNLLSQEIRFTTLVIENLELTEQQDNPDNLFTIDIDGSTIQVEGENAIAGFTDVYIDNSTISTNGLNYVIFGNSAANEIIISGSNLTGQIDTGLGSDEVRLSSGTLTGDFNGNGGNDQIILNNFIITGNVNLDGDNDRITLVGSSNVVSSEEEGTASISGGLGEDTLSLSGVGERTLSANIIDFELLEKESSSVWTLDGEVSNIANYQLLAGRLIIDENANVNFDNSTITVDNNASFVYNESEDKDEEQLNSLDNVTLNISGLATINNNLDLSVSGDLNLIGSQIIDGEGSSSNTRGVLSLDGDSSLNLQNLSTTNNVSIRFEFNSDRSPVITVAGNATLAGTITLDVTNVNENGLNDGDSFTVVDFESTPTETDVEIQVEDSFNSTVGVFVVSRDEENGNDIVLTYTIRHLVLTGEATIETTSQTANDIENPEITVNNSAIINVLDQDIEAISGFSTVTLESDAIVRADSIAISTTSMDDTVTIQGDAEIDGDVNTGDGADAVTITSSFVNGGINLGAGNDTLNISNSISGISGVITTAEGEDEITISGGSASSGTTINTGADDDVLNLTSVTFNDTIDLGEGADTLNLRGLGTFNSSVDIINLESVVLDSSSSWRLNGSSSLGDGSTDIDFSITDGVFIHSSTSVVNLGTTTGGNLTIGSDGTYRYSYSNATSGILFGPSGGIIVDGELSFLSALSSTLTTNFFNIQGTFVASNSNSERVHIIADEVNINNGTTFSNIDFTNGGTLIEIATNGSVNVNGLIVININDSAGNAVGFVDGQVYTLIDGTSNTGVTSDYTNFQYEVNHSNISSLDGTFIVQANGNDLELVYNANIVRIGSSIGLTVQQTPPGDETILIIGTSSTINVSGDTIAIDGYETLQFSTGNRVETEGALAIRTTGNADTITANSLALVGGISTLGGNDVIGLTGGTLSAPVGVTDSNINTGAGNDRITFSNTSVGYDVLTGSGDDFLEFSGSYVFLDDIALDAGNDELTLEGFVDFNSDDSSQTLDGGAGTDILRLRGTATSGSGVNIFYGVISNFETVIKSQAGLWNFEGGSQLTTTDLEIEEGTLRFFAGEIDNDSPPQTTTEGAELVINGNLTIGESGTLSLDRNTQEEAPATAHSSLSISGNIIIDGTLNASIPIDTQDNNITVTGNLNLQLGSSLTDVTEFNLEGNVVLADDVSIDSITTLNLTDNLTLGENSVISSIGALDLDGTLTLEASSSISAIETLDLDGSLVLGLGSSFTVETLNLANENSISIDFNIEDREVAAPIFINTTDINLVSSSDVITVVVSNTSATDFESGDSITLISSTNEHSLTEENFEINLTRLSNLQSRFRIEKQENNIVLIYTVNEVTLNNQTLTETQSPVSSAVEPTVTLNNSTITISDDTNALEGFHSVILSNSSITIEGTGNAVEGAEENNNIVLTNSDISGTIATGDGDDTVTLNNAVRSTNENLVFDFGNHSTTDDMDDETYEGDTLTLSGTTEQDFTYDVSNLERLNKINSSDWTLLSSLTASDQVNVEDGQLIIGEDGELTTANLNISSDTTFELAHSSAVVTATNVDIADNATLVITEGQLDASILNVTGNLDIQGNNIVVDTLDLTNRVNLTFHLDVEDVNVVSSALISATAVNFSSNQFDLFLDPQIQDSVRNYNVGDVFTIIASDSNLVVNLNQTRFTSGLFTFDIDTTTDTNQLRLIITDINNIGDLEVQSNLQNVVDALTSLDSSLVGVDNESSQVIDSINELSNPQERSDTVNYILPSVHTSSSTRLIEVAGENQKFISKYLHNRSSQTPDFLKGPDSISKESSIIWWLDFSFLDGKRDASTNNFGYNYDGNAIRLGMEREFNSGSLIGLGLAYSNIDVNNHISSGTSEEDIFSFDFYYLFTKDNLAFDFVFDYSLGENNNVRNIRGNNSTLGTTRSTVDTRSFSFAYTLRFNNKLVNNTYFYPTFGFNYNRYGFDDFTENGALPFSVEGQEYTTFNAKIGIRLEDKTRGDLGVSTTFFEAYWNYSFGDLERDINASLLNSNTDNFIISGIEEEPSSVTFGVGWFRRRAKSQIGVLYNYHFSPTASSNNISVQFKFKF